MKMTAVDPLVIVPEDPAVATLDSYGTSVPCNTNGVTTAESMVQTNVTMRAGNSKLALKAISCKISSYSLGPDYAPSSTPSPAQNFKVSATLSTGNLKIYVKNGTSLLSPVAITITATSEVEGVDESREMQFTISGNRQGQKGDDAVSYGIVAQPTAVRFSSNAVGEFQPSFATVTARVRKMTTGGSNMLTPSGNVIDGSYYLYYFDQDAGVWYRATNGSSYLSNQVRVEDVLDGLITSIPYVLSTSSTAHNTRDGITDANTVARVDVPVVCDGRRGVTGAPGATGPMFYPMSTYDSTVTYTRTDKLVPLVFYDNGVFNPVLQTDGDYYYLAKDSNVVNGVHYGPADGGGYWVKANSFGVVITMAIFANFAKLSSGIFSGDYFFSMNGRIGQTAYNGGATVGTTGIPAYMWFHGDPDAAYDLSLNGTDTQTGYGNADSATVLASGISLRKGMTLKVKARLKCGSGTARVAIRLGSSTAAAYMDFTDNTAFVEKTLELTAATDVDNASVVIYNPSSWGYAYGVGTYSFGGVFEPNWWVDLKTGKTYMGNAVVRGTVYATDGEFTGTVRARNLYRGICIVGKEERAYCSHAFLTTYEAEEWVGNFSEGSYYTEEEMRNLSGGDVGLDAAGMIACTYAADIVITPNLRNNSDPRYVYLPCAKDFEGKVVEVIDNAYTNGQTMGNIVVRAVDGGDFGGGIWGSGVARLNNQATIAAGSRGRFYSIYDTDRWWWLKIE